MLKQYRTKVLIHYRTQTGQTFEIPAGTQAVPAVYSPKQFWALEWEGMPMDARAHHRLHGFQLSEDEVEEAGHTL